MRAVGFVNFSPAVDPAEFASTTPDMIVVPGVHTPYYSYKVF